MRIAEILEADKPESKRYAYLTDKYIIDRVTAALDKQAKLQEVLVFLVREGVTVKDVAGLEYLLTRRKIQLLNSFRVQFAFNDVGNALRNLACYITIGFTPEWLLQPIFKNKDMIIKWLLKSMVGNNYSTDLVDAVLPQLMRLNLKWPELDIIYKSYQHNARLPPNQAP